MDVLIVVSGVSDYAAFRKVFDEDALDRAKFCSSMTAGLLDGHQVAIIGYGVDMPAMGAFMGTPEFAERTKGIQDGVTVYQLSEMAPPA